MIPADFLAFPGLLSMVSSRYSTELSLPYWPLRDKQLAFGLYLLPTQ